MEFEFNKYQTPITEELIQQYPEEVIEQLCDYLTNIPFIQNLVSSKRKYAKDCERDDKGRIIVDLTNPHIVENMDYFRQPALHFLKHGCYTFLKPNSNPHSEYRKFWDGEIKKCREGYIRESDGEWVTGYLYWFLNYNPMMINLIKANSKRAERVESFPFFFEGIYWRFHYLAQARDNGKHGIELAKRGAHPYSQKIITPDGEKEWGTLKIGDKLFGTYGNITTIVGIPYDSITNIYKLTLDDGRQVYSSGEHLWNVGISSKRKLGIVSTYEMMQDPFFRLKDGLYKYAIPLNSGIDFPYKEPIVDAYTLGVLLGDGCICDYRTDLTCDIADLETYKNNIPYPIIKIGKDKIHHSIKIPEYKDKFTELGIHNTTSSTKFIPDSYKYNSREVRLALLQGLMDTDGWCCSSRSPQFCTISHRLKDDIIWIARSLGYKVLCVKKKSGYKKNNTYIRCKDSYTITICGGGAELFRLKRKQDIADSNKKIYKNFSSIVNIEYVGEEKAKCVIVDSEDESYLVGDFITTHNCAKSYTLSSIMTHNLILGETSTSNRRVMTVLTAYQKEYLKDDKDGTFSKFRPALNFIASNTPFPRLLLKNSPNEMSWQMGYKDEFGKDCGSLNTVMGVAIKEDEAKLRGKRANILFEEMGTMPNLLSVYDTCRRSVEDGDFTFAQMYLVGTANEDEADFSSAKKLLQNPSAYNIYALNNVWDKPNQGSKKFGFFFPAYVNRAGCYNKDGVSDVIKALLEILTARYKAKYNSADPKSVLRIIAEDPITPAEAIIKVKSAYFPVSALNERLLQLDQDPNILNEVYVGTLALRSGKVEFTPSNDEPIRKYGVANDTPGAIEIFQMPEKDSNGNVFQGRYIMGHDPVDNDAAESSSLSSTFVFDLFTDKIVAEFTGRKQFADDNFEIVRLLALFYNATVLFESNKKGIYAYFKQMGCTHLLAPTPEHLREKNLIKYNAFGSNAFGVNASAAINNYANGLIRDWLLKPTAYSMRADNGEMVEEIMPMLYSIKNRALIEELIAFTPEINVDRIRALGMVMLLRQEKIVLYQGDMSSLNKEIKDSDYLGNDDFFTRNFDKKRFISR